MPDECSMRQKRVVTYFGRALIWRARSLCFHCLSARFAKTVSALQKTGQELSRCYFKAGSINVRSVAGSNRFCIATGSTVAITSSLQ